MPKEVAESDWENGNYEKFLYSLTRTKKWKNWNKKLIKLFIKIIVFYKSILQTEVGKAPFKCFLNEPHLQKKNYSKMESLIIKRSQLEII